MHTTYKKVTYYLNISVQVANLSDCQIEKNWFGSKNRIESKLFLPKLKCSTASVVVAATVECDKWQWVTDKKDVALQLARARMAGWRARQDARHAVVRILYVADWHRSPADHLVTEGKILAWTHEFMMHWLRLRAVIIFVWEHLGGIRNALAFLTTCCSHGRLL